ncbi:DUF72 domain-containing protein [Stetteria hydrogenophila]
MEVKVGTCGFQKSRKKHYSELDVVEVQQTFYDPRGVDAFKRWRSEAPDSFEFTVKVWMLVTHGYNKKLWRRLKWGVPGDVNRYKPFELNREVIQAMEATLEAAKALNARILVFQTPASFKPSRDNAAKIVRFMRELGLSGYTLVWEPRGEWWSRGELLVEVAREAGLVICGDVLRGRIPPVVEDLLYTRLHGLGGRGEVNYKYKYTRNDLERLRGILHELRPSRAYVLFNNVYAFEDAVAFKSMIRQDRAEREGAG